MSVKLTQRNLEEKIDHANILSEFGLAGGEVDNGVKEHSPVSLLKENDGFLVGEVEGGFLEEVPGLDSEGLGILD